MAFSYLELTRRQLAAKIANSMPLNMSKQDRAKYRENIENAAGDITPALNLLGADNWELVSVVVAPDSGSEVLYVFKK